MADKKKDLHTLIRLRKWNVDERQRALAVLLNHEESVLERIDALEAEKKAELAFAGKSPADQRMTLTPYLERCARFRVQLDAALADIRKRIAAAQEDLAEAYRRLKTFEVTQEQRDVAEEKELSRLEVIDLDEIGLNLHRRKAV